MGCWKMMKGLILWGVVSCKLQARLERSLEKRKYDRLGFCKIDMVPKASAGRCCDRLLMLFEKYGLFCSSKHVKCIVDRHIGVFLS